MALCEGEKMIREKRDRESERMRAEKLEEELCVGGGREERG